MNQRMKGNLLLFLTAFIWGCAFVAQRTGMEYIGPLTFNGIRSIVGGVTLLIYLFVRTRLQKKTESNVKDESLPQPPSKKFTFLCGLVCGICLFAGTTLQQMGMVYTTAGKAGFITALYIILVPLVGILLGKKIRLVVWGGVILALMGLYLLCVGEDFTVNKGDMLILLCSFAFTIHITFVDKVSQRIDGVVISCIQLFVCGVISIPGMILLEEIDWNLILQCMIPILYAGVLSCGVAYTLQIVAQKYTEPTVASMIMSLESVFALLSGMIILKETIKPMEILGCVIMFVAIILAQLPERKTKSVE
ncbi:MAG: DMT family transporter [Lachnospiraceae bacterium]|nr:DMT family transporter [Lachnospiraceae bacterium]